MFITSTKLDKVGWYGFPLKKMKQKKSDFESEIIVMLDELEKQGKGKEDWISMDSCGDHITLSRVDL